MIDLAMLYAQYQADEERERQRNVITARNYYAGDQVAKLSERQKEFLGFNLAKERFAVNYCATVVDAVVERMIVDHFSSADEALAAWVLEVWKAARMDAKQQAVHHAAVNDGEHFVLVDWPEGAKYPRLLSHPRYTDAEDGGTGFGCKAHYVEDDPNQELEAVSKRWTESYRDDNGRTRQRTRMNVYYPGRTERYVRATAGQYAEAGWAKFTDDDDGPVVVRLRSDGTPMRIPWAHFIKPGRLELWDAIPLQDLINKTALDIVAAVDAAGFPIRLAYGFTPTTDGKAPDGTSNLLALFPGCWIAIPTGEGNKVDFQPGEDPTPLLNTLDSYIMKLAQVTDTPVARFQMGRQVRAEGTLQQEEEPLLAKIRAYATQFGNGWEDAFYIARELANERGMGLNEDAALDTEWEPAETRNKLQELQGIEIKARVGVPQEQLWAEMGYDAEEIAAMRAMVSEAQAAQANLGGALLERFERGV